MFVYSAIKPDFLNPPTETTQHILIHKLCQHFLPQNLNGSKYRCWFIECSFWVLARQNSKSLSRGIYH